MPRAQFFDFASAFVDRIGSPPYAAWADYIDPCSGLPMRTPGNTVYSEIDGMAMLLPYERLNAGMCSVLAHPQWGTSIYPATIFTTAPPDAVAHVLASFVEEGWPAAGAAEAHDDA